MDAYDNGTSSTDYTGYSITSNKPVSVSAGHGYVMVRKTNILCILGADLNTAYSIFNTLRMPEGKSILVRVLPFSYRMFEVSFN